MTGYEATPEEAVRPTPLLTGHDLIAAGYTPGPRFTRCSSLSKTHNWMAESGQPREPSLLFGNASAPLRCRNNATIGDNRCMPSSARTYDAIVLGAGAAGLMCAAVAGQRGRRVALLEHNAQPGRKILISGGGRCNFTNIHCTPANFLSSNPHFAKSALALYQPQHFLELVERYRIPWHEKTLGQLFCDGSARASSTCCSPNARRRSVESCPERARSSCRTGRLGVSRRLLAGRFHRERTSVATGGLSIPKMGATGLAYDLARQFGLHVV